MRCQICNGLLEHLGDLGTDKHYRCRHCGMQFAWTVKLPRKSSRKSLEKAIRDYPKITGEAQEVV